MNFVSLFAGVGGFDLAFERAGMDCVGQVEIDKNCREVLSEHWSDVPRWEDIHEVTADRIRLDTGRPVHRRSVTDDPSGVGSGHGVTPGDLQLDRGTTIGDFGGTAVDVLVGGFPCQDYSVAGRRGGLAGDRGALWWQFHRLIAECRPRWVVGENVPGLLSSNSGRDFGTIVGSLVELGYGVCWRVLDAQYFGVAQRRRRVLIVGHSGGQPRPEILFEPESLSGDPPPRREAGKDVAPTLGSRTKGGGGLGTDTELDGALIAIETGQGWWRDSDVAGTLSQRDWKDAKTVAFNPYRTATGPGEYVEGFKPDEIHDALTANPAPKGPPLVVAPSVRRLTPLECERLQGFPDNWTATQSDTQRYRQMGNAVAVPVAEWVANRIAKAT